MPRLSYKLAAPVIVGCKEPMFAEGVIEQGQGLRVYLDRDGMWACCNFKPTQSFRPCSLCGNHCITFVADGLDYTCSACGKFPPEILLQ